MELFDILKAFFNKKNWEDVSNHDKARNFFMINRIMGIAFPLQANAFNSTKIDPVSVVNYWKETLNTKYKAPPGWFLPPHKRKKNPSIFPQRKRFLNLLNPDMKFPTEKSKI